VVGGDQDAVTPVEELRGMAALIPGARFEVVPQAGHLANLEQPAGFGELLGAFLAQAYPPGG
jgi:pimeloyl-ACP methyl ester carboxylesterase